MSLQGQELIEGRAFLDVCEAKWLVTLAEFDAANAFELDGHASCVHWLVERCGMGRSTAKEKLRSAHELCRRPVVADAFITGLLSYSKARAFTRLDGLDDARDAALIGEYAGESADMIERVVRWWNLRNGGQDGPAPDPYDQPRVRFQPGFGGATGRIIIDGANEDLQRFMNLVDAYGSFLYFTNKKAEEMVEPVDEASMKPPTLHADNPDEPAERIHKAIGTEPPIWDPVAGDEASVEPLRSLAQKRFDWLSDLFERSLSSAPTSWIPTGPPSQ